MADNRVVVSTAVSPSVAYEIKREGEVFRLTVEAAAFEGGGQGVSVEAGISADKTLRLGRKDARVDVREGSVRYEFNVPANKLSNSHAGWEKLRIAFSVEWAGVAGQPARLKQSFLHNRPRAAHAGLSPDPLDWQLVNLEEWQRQAVDRSLQIAIDYDQPVDGKVSIVIDDASGKRIRNLASAQSMAKGRQRVVWDGLDEQGNVALPGDYRWRAIAHPGLTPTYLFDFVNGPGSNHGTLHSAAFNGSSLFFASPVAEGGHEFIELDVDGSFKRGFNPPHGHGLKDVAIAVDGQFLYAVHDGMAWGDKIDRTKADWKGTDTLSLLRINLETWSVAEFPGNIRFAVLNKHDFGPGSTGARSEGSQALAGVAHLQGRLYVGDSVDGMILVIDPKTGNVERRIPFPGPRAIAVSRDQLYAIGDTGLNKVDPVTGAAKVIARLAWKSSGLAVGGDGRFFISDSQSHVVHVLESDGKDTGMIGKPGGSEPGPYDPLKFKNPNGLVVSGSLLWMTEKGRWEPKRLSAYDIQSRQLAKEYFGPTNYGAQGAGFDDMDHSRWIGQGTLFKLDFKTKTANPVSILGGELGRRNTYWRQDGRAFVLTADKATYIQELMPDGRLYPRAMFSSAHQFAYKRHWNPPQVFVDAFQQAYPGVLVSAGQRGGIQRVQPNHGYGMLWVDRNGDGEMQQDEIEFATAATNLGGSGWSHDFHDLTMRVPAEVGGKKVLVTLKPDGWWPGGAPRYPALNEAVKAGIPIDLPGSNQIESAVDRFGNTILNSSPHMRAFSSEGKLLWTYPNRWSGVHGSHDAPLPSPGQLQGALFFSGVVPLDEKSDVLLMNGNHGQAFLMTSDGLYLDAIFPDCRLMTNPQASGVGILGGECFGGSFGKSAADGNYYFQGGGIAYRIYRIDGLRETSRFGGQFKVSAAQSVAFERNQLRQVIEKKEAPQAVVPRTDSAPALDGKDPEWKQIGPVAKWDRNGKFPVKVRAAYDANTLYLHYTVKDESPWVNKGKDWQTLFKTGDGIDLQLGTDTAAKNTRTGPVPGDLRLFIAPSTDGDVAVLYKHRAPGAKQSEGVVFQSPWRSERVDVVRKLTDAKIYVDRSGGGYRVKVAVPLADLGLSNLGGKTLRADFGVIYGDGEGTTNIFRNYWSNEATGLVNDVPGEIMLTPNLWGGVTFGSESK